MLNWRSFSEAEVVASHHWLIRLKTCTVGNNHVILIVTLIWPSRLTGHYKPIIQLFYLSIPVILIYSASHRCEGQFNFPGESSPNLLCIALGPEHFLIESNLLMCACSWPCWGHASAEGPATQTPAAVPTLLPTWRGKSTDSGRKSVWWPPGHVSLKF